MSYFVYILFSKKDKKLYTGCTTNLEQRLRAHNSGSVLATKHKRPLIVIYKEEYNNESEAFKRERFLKSLWGGRFKKKILNNCLSQSK